MSKIIVRKIAYFLALIFDKYKARYDKIIKQITKPNNINKYILGAIEIKEER